MAEEPTNALELVLGEVEVLLDPVLQAAEGARQRKMLLQTLGWDLDAITGLPVSELDDALTPIGALISALTDGLDVSDFGKIVDALQGAGNAIAAIGALDDAARAKLPAIPAGALAIDLVDFLVVRYVRLRFPRVYALLSLATLVDLPDSPSAAIFDPTSGAMVFVGSGRPILRFDRLALLFTDPAGLFKAVYWPDGVTDAVTAGAVADRLLPRVAEVVRAFGGDARYGVDKRSGDTWGSPENDALVAHMLTLNQPLPPAISDDGVALFSEVDLTIGIVPPDGPHSAGVVLVPHGSAQVRGAIGEWAAEIALSGTPGGLVLTREGVQFEGSSAMLSADLTAERLPGEQGAAVLIGSRDGTHFAIGTVRATAGVTIGEHGIDPRLGFELLEMELVIKAGDGDSFLKAVLPPDGMRMPIEFGLMWSPSTGVVFHGGATLEIELPIDLDLNIIRIPSVFLSLGFKVPAAKPPEVALGVGATIEVEVGPVYGSIEKMGIALVASFPPKGGNLGPIDLGLRFLPPKGVALSVDAGPVSGGGYILLDFDKGEYAGILHLEIAGTVSITAIALLQTKMPDGSEGYSLVVIISVEFSVQLGYGFVLLGVGGIVGINRSMNVPALQDALRHGAIGSLLFPSNPIPRARQIIADIGAIFPPTEGQFVLGPMVKLGWGGGMISLAVAIVIQFPSLKIALLGRLQLLVPPVEEAAIIVLRLDFAGVVDVPAKMVSFDGTLDGSRVAVFPIGGDIAMRADFGEQPDFAFSAGGLHPDCKVPPGFPKLRRLSISLAEGDSPRVRMEAYFAVTPATLQFGGHAELYYGVDAGVLGKLEIDASAGLDALITFPANFEVDLNVHVLLRRNGQPFIGVELDIKVTGAQPLDIDGHATLHFMGDHSIPFHKTIGGPTTVPALGAVDVEGAVAAALADARNWSALPPASATGVRLRDVTSNDGAAVVHPLGTLAVHQTVAPLGIALEKMGDAPIQGTRLLNITHVTVPSAPGSTSGGVPGAALPTTGLPKIYEQFAPSQFFHVSDRQRLEQPGFERMQAGLAVDTGGVLCTGIRSMPLGYEDIEIPPEPDAPVITLVPVVFGPALASWTITGGVAAKGPTATKQRFMSAPLGITVRADDGFVVSNAATPTEGGLLTADEHYTTAAEAFASARGRDVVVAVAGEPVA